MIIIDTNVISEAMKPRPFQPVISWLNAQETTSLFLSAITVGEIEFGLCTMPSGKRRTSLQEKFESIVSEAFVNRILVFDESAARVYGQLMAERRKLGKPLSIPDGQIASTARIRGFAVATRNSRDFADSGIQVINPFSLNQ